MPDPTDDEIKDYLNNHCRDCGKPSQGCIYCNDCAKKKPEYDYALDDFNYDSARERGR